MTKSLILRFPAIENYTPEEMASITKNGIKLAMFVNGKKWAMQFVHTVQLKQKNLWNLINICATYSAEPGIFFIDNANEKTNAKAYGQKVVATNPCGEQPLAPYSVCNLAAVNLSEIADKETKTVDFEALKETVRVGVRMQDNVIDATPYFLEENEIQALR